MIVDVLITFNLSGKRAFIAGVADDNGYGWAIAKALAAAGAEILVGTWVPVCWSDSCWFHCFGCFCWSVISWGTSFGRHLTYLRQVCGEENLMNHGSMYFRTALVSENMQCISRLVVTRCLTCYWYRLPDGSLMDIVKVYPLDAVFDSPEDVPEDVMF